MRLKAIRLLAPLLLAASLPGCLFSPDKKPPKDAPPPPEYPGQFSPAATLETMRLAYQARDSVTTKAVYDIAYKGESIDPSGFFNDPDISRQEEVDHVRRLHDAPGIVRVDLDFGNMAAWQRIPPDAADPPEWAQIQINTARIQVDDINAVPGQTTTYESLNQALTYTFRPTATAPAETTWTIVRWQELVTRPPTLP